LPNSPSPYLVFGATGAAGRFLLPRLVERGDTVHAVSRAAQPPGAPRLTWLRGDLRDRITAPAAEYDAIVSLGPLDAFADWIAAPAAPHARRVVALSSMSADSKRESADTAERALAARLLAAEARLAAACAARDATWTILRPTLIYGDGRDRSLAPIARFARRWHVLPVPIGASGLRQPVHAADVAAAILACADSAAAGNRIYPLGGGERLTFRRLLLRLRAAMSTPVLPLPVPLWSLRLALCWLPAGSAAALARLRQPLVADNSSAAADFGYSPRAFDAAAAVALPHD
jgi:nucleoside-diphosphate-sugar epimerase